MADISPNTFEPAQVANGTQKDFAFNFSAVGADEVQVRENGVAINKALYTVTVGDTSGTVHYAIAPAANTQIVIVSDPDFTQASHFGDQSAYNLSTVNTINRRSAVRDLVLRDRIQAIDPTNIAASLALIEGFAESTQANADLVNVLATQADDDADRAEAAAQAAAASAAAVGIYGKLAAFRVPRGLTVVSVANGGAANATTAANVALTWAAGNWVYPPRVLVDITAGVVSNPRIIDPGLSLLRAGVRPTATIPGAGAGAALNFTVGTRIANGATYYARNVTGQGFYYEAYYNNAGVPQKVPGLQLSSGDMSDVVEPWQYAYAAANWSEQLKRIQTGSYVDSLGGTDATPDAVYMAPAKSINRVKALYADGTTMVLLKAGQNYVSRETTTGIQFGNDGLSKKPRNVSTYGSSPLAPRLDARQNLSGKVWTPIAGNQWETTATMLSVPVWNAAGGINDAASSTPRFWFETDAENPYPMAPGQWITNQGSRAANEAASAAIPWSWTINAVGNNASDIRTCGLTGAAAQAVRLTVTTDGTDPNGKPYKLGDAQGSARFNGGEYGHLRLIGGISKDSASMSCMDASVANSPVPTFMSLTIEQGSCHLSVGEKNIVGKFTGICLPAEGTPSQISLGRGIGACLHWFTPNNLRMTDLYCGDFEIANNSIGAYAHPSGPGPAGYRRITVLRRSKITNMGNGVKFDGGGAPRVGFLADGYYALGGHDMVDVTNAYSPTDEPNFVAIGGYWEPKNTGRATFLSPGGSNNYIRIADHILNASAVSAAGPGFYVAILLQWVPYYGYPGSTPPTIEFDNVQDVTAITGTTQPCGWWQAGGSFDKSYEVHLRLLNGCEFGDVWRFGSYNSFPMSFYADATRHVFGIGGMTRQQFRDAMAALNRPCTCPDTVTMVNVAGAVVDPPSI